MKIIIPAKNGLVFLTSNSGKGNSMTKDIKVYSTSTCPYCHMVKKFLSDNKITFTDIDVSENQQAAQEMTEKSGQMGVPVVDIDGKIIIGFDRDAIKKELAI